VPDTPHVLVLDDPTSWLHTQHPGVAPGQRPVCHQQETVLLHPPGAGILLRCHLPAGHHSPEHYDALHRTVWLSHGTDPADTPEPGAPDAPWT